MQHAFKYEMTNPDRNTTKKNWKAIQRWIREVRNKVEKEIDWDAAKQAISDAMITGTGIYAR